MVKLFVSDMDGTLLNEEHVISDRNASAVKALQQAGIEFVIATGRAYNSAKPILDVHNINCKMINLNGAAVYNLNGEIETKIPLEIGTVKKMLKYLDESDTEYSVMTDKYFYVDDKEAFIERVHEMLRKLDIEKHTNIKTDDAYSSDAQFIHEIAYIKGMDEFSYTDDTMALKFMVFGEPSDNKLTNFYEAFKALEDLDITSSGPDNLEITHSKAQKGFAVEKYAASRGISMEDVATIGDSLNDRSMLKMAGHSYAMGNSAPEVIEMAKTIAPSHREDGVAVVIEELLKQL
ncbi:HAD family phosphatase [Aerococcaceae bacterium DSM 111021]|nr:HAD family phosphatase [Aerococcaceae bacterium DSM 111021]